MQQMDKAMVCPRPVVKRSTPRHQTSTHKRSRLSWMAWTDPLSCAISVWSNLTTRHLLSSSNSSTVSSPTLTTLMSLSICKRKLKRRQRREFAASLRFLVTHVISIQRIAAILSMVKNVPCSTSSTGSLVDCQTCKERHTQPSSSSPSRSLTSICTTKIWEILFSSTRTYKQNFRLCIQTLRRSDRRVWTLLSSKKRSPNLNRRRSSYWRRLIFSRTEVTLRTSSFYLMQHPSFVKSRSKMPV